MLYFSVDTDDGDAHCIVPVESEPVSSDTPVSAASHSLEKDTLKYRTIQGILDGYKGHMNQLINQLDALVNYTEICYENKEDERPFGPDVLFQIKWCCEYWREVAEGTAVEREVGSNCNVLSDETIAIYDEYKECVRVLMRAFLVAYRISCPAEYDDMVHKKFTIIEYLYGMEPLANLDAWFKEERYYKVLEHLYYKTLNVRDEMEFLISY